METKHYGNYAVWTNHDDGKPYTVEIVSLSVSGSAIVIDSETFKFGEASPSWITEGREVTFPSPDHAQRVAELAMATPLRQSEIVHLAKEAKAGMQLPTRWRDYGGLRHGWINGQLVALEVLAPSTIVGVDGDEDDDDQPLPQRRR